MRYKGKGDRQRTIMSIRWTAVVVGLAGVLLVCNPSSAARRPVGVEGVRGGYRGSGGGVKTGDYNDSNNNNNADDKAAAAHDSMANDPNAGINDSSAGA